MLASVISGQRERLIRKKSKRHWISGFSLLQVKRSGFSTRQISASSKSSLMASTSSTSSLDFLGLHRIKVTKKPSVGCCLIKNSGDQAQNMFIIYPLSHVSTTD